MIDGKAGGGEGGSREPKRGITLAEAVFGGLSALVFAATILAITYGFDSCGPSHELKCVQACKSGVASVSPVHCACK